MTDNTTKSEGKLPNSDDFLNKLEESINFHNKGDEIEKDKCFNGEIRCKARCYDSDEYCFKEQCNLNDGHEGKHRFGLDSCLYGVFPPSTCDIENDDHDGSCSVCMVREVRGR